MTQPTIHRRNVLAALTASAASTLMSARSGLEAVQAVRVLPGLDAELEHSGWFVANRIEGEQ